MRPVTPTAVRTSLAIAVVSALLASGCGDEQSSITAPTRPVLLGTSTFSGGMSASSSFCLDIRTGAQGPVNVVAEPQHLVLNLGPGPCSRPEASLGERAGEITATLPAGDHHVIVTNTRDSDTQVSLRVRYPV